jgi:hypothetical protein
MTNRQRPAESEYAPFYSGYISLVPEEDVLAALESQARETAALLGTIDEGRAGHRYAPEKWSIKELVGHVGDAERVFAYRTLCIGRGETKSLPGFDEGPYVRAGNFDRRPLADLAADLAATRASTLALLRGFDEEAWGRSGVANDVAVSVRALAYITVGHERHHMRVLRERYLPTAG